MGIPCNDKTEKRRGKIPRKQRLIHKLSASPPLAQFTGSTQIQQNYFINTTLLHNYNGLHQNILLLVQGTILHVYMYVSCVFFLAFLSESRFGFITYIFYINKYYLYLSVKEKIHSEPNLLKKFSFTILIFQMCRTITFLYLCFYVFYADAIESL